MKNPPTHDTQPPSTHDALAHDAPRAAPRRLVLRSAVKASAGRRAIIDVP